MSAPRVVLWDPSLNATSSSDSAGIDIKSSLYPPPAFFHPAPYQTSTASTSAPLRYAPSLAYFCIRAIVDIPEDIHYFGPPRLFYENHAHGTYDILRALMPHAYSPHDKDPTHVRLDRVDPRLWAAIIQVFRDLPSHLRIYPVALSDPHLSLLQDVPSSPEFTLITVLSLPGFSHLNDDTIFQLKHLHGLSALDASRTTLTAHGIRRLSETLAWTEQGDDVVSQRRGPWQLRVLVLRSCQGITNKIFQTLDRFPLLSVADLRDTRCDLRKLAHASSFRPSLDQALPRMGLVEMLSALSSQDGFFSSSNRYILRVDRLHYGDRAVGFDRKTCSSSLRPMPSVAREDSFVVFDKNSRTAIASGNSESLERIKERVQERKRHARNLYAKHGYSLDEFGSREEAKDSYGDYTEEYPVRGGNPDDLLDHWGDSEQENGSDYDSDNSLPPAPSTLSAMEDHISSMAPIPGTSVHRDITSLTTDVMNEIAATEAAEAEATRAAGRFYSSSTMKEARPTYTSFDPPLSGYFRQYPAENLFLCRNPPPWKILQTLSPPPVSKAHSQIDTPVPVDRNSARGLRGVRAIQETLNKRRQTMQRADGFQGNAPLRTPGSRNPFAQCSAFGEGKTTASNARSKATNFSAIDTAGTSRPSGPLAKKPRMSPPSSAKPLKPISTIAVPILPKNESGTKRASLPGPSQGGLGKTPSRKITPESSLDSALMPTVQQRTPANSTDSKLRPAKPSAIRKSAAKVKDSEIKKTAGASKTTRSPPAEKSATGRGKGGKETTFNWNAWIAS